MSKQDDTLQLRLGAYSKMRSLINEKMKVFFEESDDVKCAIETICDDVLKHPTDKDQKMPYRMFLASKWHSLICATA